MRPTNKYQVMAPYTEATYWPEVPVHIWEVKLGEIDPVTFRECYADGHNASDTVASQWLLANFTSMCPCAIDSDVLVDKDKYEKWTKLDFSKEKVIEAEDVMSALADTDFNFYGPGEFDDCEWPAVDLISQSQDKKEWRTDTTEINKVLAAVGWRLGKYNYVGRSREGEDGTWYREVTRSVVPLEHNDDDDDYSDDDSDAYEDGWHGILLSRVFLVDEDRDASILGAAGFRVLQHEDTGTCIAQVTFCGMSNEVNRARAGYLLAVDRGWPILTNKGWRRPVR